jgi:predicted transcriptional regulator
MSPSPWTSRCSPPPSRHVWRAAHAPIPGQSARHWASVKTSAEIAQILGLSKRTVDFHIDNARSKLGVATRIQAAIKAATAQLIEP